MLNDLENNPDAVKSLDEKDIIGQLDEIIPILKKEKTLVEISGKVGLIGDTHGDFETTKSIIKNFIDLDHLIFLGDYIDREPIRWGSIYNLTYLLYLKCKYPEKIILLKGNHECNYIIPCIPYDFENEIEQRFGTSDLHYKFVEIFHLMPLMSLANNVFAAHGGILKGFDLDGLKRIEKNDKMAIEALTWSDPAISLKFRGAGFPFDNIDLSKFLSKIKAKVFVRGHDYNLLGYSIYGDKCLTILSSRLYKEMGNCGILVAIAENKVNKASDLSVSDFSSGNWTRYKIFKK